MLKIIRPATLSNDDAFVKLLWLGIIDIDDKRAADRAAEAAAGAPHDKRNAAGHLACPAACAVAPRNWPGNGCQARG